MIGRLRGDVVAKAEGSVLLEVGGVGYEVAVTPATIAELPSVGQPAVLHTHLHVREDILALYGFATADERDVFQILIGVSGVGPKLALAVLATLGRVERGLVIVWAEITILVPGGAHERVHGVGFA